MLATVSKHCIKTCSVTYLHTLKMTSRNYQDTYIDFSQIFKRCFELTNICYYILRWDIEISLKIRSSIFEILIYFYKSLN